MLYGTFSLMAPTLTRRSACIFPPQFPLNAWARLPGQASYGKGSPAPQGAMTPLLDAVREDNREIIKLLLASGAQINQPDANGTTALLLALIDGHLDLAQFLIERGADINSADGYGRTPLFAAIDARDAGFYANPLAGTNETSPLDVIKSLLDRGAHPDVRTKAVVPIVAGSKRMAPG